MRENEAYAGHTVTDRIQIGVKGAWELLDFAEADLLEATKPLIAEFQLLH
jgi:hypothetical protein